MRYELKQIIIDAIQFNGYNIDTIRELTSKHGIGVQPYAYSTEDTNFLRYFELNYEDCYGRLQNKVVWTTEYVIRYANGDCVSCDEHTFNERYTLIRRQ